MRNQQSLKRIFVTYLCITVVTVVMIGLYGSFTASQLYLDDKEQDLEARARLCMNQILEHLRGEHDDVDALCKKLGHAVKTRITVIRPDGEVLGDTEKNPQSMDNHKNRPEVHEALTEERGVGHSTRYSTTLEEHLMYVAVASPSGQPPQIVVRASIPVTVAKKKLAMINQNIILAGVVAVILITAVSPWFSFRNNRQSSKAEESDSPEPDEPADGE